MHNKVTKRNKARERLKKEDKEVQIEIKQKKEQIR